MNHLCRLSLLLPAVLIVASCGKAPAATAKSKSAAKTAAQAAPVSGGEARKMFDSLCSTCHGSKGIGDGPGAAALDPKPRSFADSVWQDSVTDEHLEKVILYGGTGVGKSAMMPAQPQLKGKTKVLKALIKIIRDFRK